VRVGLAFSPSRAWGTGSLTEDVKLDVLETIAATFRGRENIGDVRVIPSAYLEPGGGFQNLDRIAAAFGVDLAVLISYDQAQFSETGAASNAYWTLIGAYVICGQRQETRTVLDAAVFDIRSRALLFTATGEDRTAGRATPVAAERRLRERGEAGFRSAAEDLVAKLDVALAEFQKQAAAGTVRGPGTPAIAVRRRDAGPAGEDGGGVAGGPPGASLGGGAAGPVEVGLAELVDGAGFADWLRRRA
jgi:rhombotail lipoprotein